MTNYQAASGTESLNPNPTKGQLFSAFCKVGLLGFGGVLPTARFMMVDKKTWVSDKEFTELYSLAQFFPGPNIANVCVIYGRLTQGYLGSICAIAGLYFFPAITTIVAGLLIAKFWHLYPLQQVFGAITSASAGIMLGAVLKMAKSIWSNLANILVVGCTTILMIGKLPLFWVIVICTTLAIVLQKLFATRKRYKIK